MKKLVILRHGKDEGGPDTGLSLTGRRQATDIAEKLSKCLDGNSVLILSSSALRAHQTAGIVAERLQTGFEDHDILWSGGGGKVQGLSEDFAEALELIKNHPRKTEVVILVTHYEYVEGFPFFFGRKYLEGAVLPFENAIPKGTAWLIDCETKKMIHIQ